MYTHWRTGKKELKTVRNKDGLNKEINQTLHKYAFLSEYSFLRIWRGGIERNRRKSLQNVNYSKRDWSFSTCWIFLLFSQSKRNKQIQWMLKWSFTQTKCASYVFILQQLPEKFLPRHWYNLQVHRVTHVWVCGVVYYRACTNVALYRHDSSSTLVRV